MDRTDLPYCMARMIIDGQPSIGLARRQPGGRGHVMVWAVSFDDPLVREYLFAWLERNAARWPVWGAIASARGSAALSRHIDESVGEEAMAGAPVMIQLYRAAAYLGCAEADILAFRDREECAPLFGDEPDPLLAERPMTFVDLGGLVRRMVTDAASNAGERRDD